VQPIPDSHGDYESRRKPAGVYQSRHKDFVKTNEKAPNLLSRQVEGCCEQELDLETPDYASAR
jgi:hypothetical protein